jgi:hypothetical protein
MIVFVLVMYSLIITFHASCTDTVFWYVLCAQLILNQKFEQCPQT